MLRQNINEIDIPILATVADSKDVCAMQACRPENNVSPNL